VNDVRSGGHIDGDGGVVGRHVEDGSTTWQDIQLCLLLVVFEGNRATWQDVW